MPGDNQPDSKKGLKKTNMYIVFEGGGIEYDPRIHGVFTNLGKAKECIKKAMLDFIKIHMAPYEIDGSKIIVDKQYYENYTYFRIFVDQENVEYGAYENMFILTEYENVYI